ncbi:hypothetical protein ACJX0J_022499 [Zea mays]
MYREKHQFDNDTPFFTHPQDFLFSSILNLIFIFELCEEIGPTSGKKTSKMPIRINFNSSYYEIMLKSLLKDSLHTEKFDNLVLVTLGKVNILLDGKREIALFKRKKQNEQLFLLFEVKTLYKLEGLKKYRV